MENKEQIDPSITTMLVNIDRASMVDVEVISLLMNEPDKGAVFATALQVYREFLEAQNTRKCTLYLKDRYGRMEKVSL